MYGGKKSWDELPDGPSEISSHSHELCFGQLETQLTFESKVCKRCWVMAKSKKNVEKTMVFATSKDLKKTNLCEMKTNQNKTKSKTKMLKNVSLDLALYSARRPEPKKGQTKTN